MKTLYTAEAVAQNGRTGRVESSDGNLKLDLDKPQTMGGKQAGATNPEQLFAAAYAACFQGALQNAAGRAHKTLTGATVKSRVSLNEDDQGGYNLSVELRASLPGIDRGDAEKLLAQAHQTCPYSKATRGNVEVKLALD